jgi:hypothetical protein
MFLASGISFTVALTLTAQIMTVSDRNSDPFKELRRDQGHESRSELSGNSRRGHDGSRDGGHNSWRGHNGESRHRQRSDLDLLVVPSVAFANPTTRVPLPSPNAQAAMRVPFLPPAQFSYYCNDPPGWFPTVTACAGRWLETGARPSP